MVIVATIEARMGSSRLPGKVLFEAAGKTMLEHLVLRLKKVKLIDDIVIATTSHSSDDPIVDFCKKSGVNFFRGSVDNVMSRVIGAAESVGASTVVEITGDCPIIDYSIVEQSIKIFQSHDVDYVSNVIIRSYPDGMDTQVFKLETLKKSASMTADKLDLEHVSLHIRNNPEIFSRIHMIAPIEVRWPDLGLTLDEVGDYNLIKWLIEKFGDSNPFFSCLEAINKIKKNPSVVSFNEYVERKGNT